MSFFFENISICYLHTGTSFIIVLLIVFSAHFPSLIATGISLLAL